MIELDHNATTRPTPGVVAAMRGVLEEFWHNPSSMHRGGQAARAAVERARESVAGILHARPREIVFTSGGTEAIDLSIRGLLGAFLARRPGVRPAIVTSRIEHSAVRDLVLALERQGAIEARWIPVRRDGVVDEAAAIAMIDERAAIVSVQWANNETGAIQPVEAIGQACRARGPRFHSDATQCVGKLPVPAGIERWCDVLSFSAHKLHGPKGAGAMWVRPGVGLAPSLHGAQELGRRGGTENVAGIVGFARACNEAVEWLADETPRRAAAELLAEFEAIVLAGAPGSAINGPRALAVHPEPGRRLWNTANIAFPRLEAEAILLALSEAGVNASAGAACASGSLEPSPLLLSMGVPPELAHGSVRFSLARDSTREEVLEGARIVLGVVRRLASATASAVARS